MTKPRTLLFTLLSLSSVALLLSSCDGDDDTIGTSGGTSGTAPGIGGSNGGSGGSSGGRGGTSGSAQSGTGATDAGVGGEGAAQPGSGGTLSIGGAGSGGVAGNPPGGAGNGAEAGTTVGGAGAGGAPNDGPQICQTGCTTNDDCESPLGNARCDETLHVCVECSTNADCVWKASGWNTACESDTDCTSPLFSTCVEIAGLGRCADPSSNGCLGGEPQPFPRFGIEPEELVNVCAVDSGRCDAQHHCVIGCTDSGDFCTNGSPGHGDTCNETTRLCECTTDDECTAGAPHCNQVTHLCDECATSDDCSGAPTGRECHEGRCGCSSTSMCPDSSFPDGTPLCK